ncbi:MAG: hypothetical protein H6713_01810 [Myxococcales bacterium]|nr:hypothetical protein [Myxococcales bacterium]
MLGASPLPKANEEILLPQDDDQAWLLGELARLIKRQGFETLVNAPMLEPTPMFFPDRWAGGEPSMRRLAQRLLHYAGLGELTAVVHIFEESDERRGEDENKPQAIAGETIDVWFSGFARDAQGRRTCRFGVEGVAMRDPASLVAITARAVAAAYRAHHGLKVPDRVTEERLVDVTTHYLGFGILTTDAARKHVTIADGSFRSKPKLLRVGVLGPHAMGFLLAAHAHARGLDRKGHRHIARRLPDNQAAFFRRALEVLAPEESVRARLGVPDMDEWPDPMSMRSLIPEIAAEDGEDENAVEERKGVDKGVVGMNAGKPVFRVERRASLRVAKLLALPVLMGGGMVARGFQGVDIPMWAIMAASAGLALLGLLIGWMLTDSRCSEPKCGAELTAEHTSCPRCGGDIVGVIDHPKKRLAAEEALRLEQAPSAEPPAPDAPKPAA